MVLSLLKKGAFLKALSGGTLSAKDLTAVKLCYNDPDTMIFTILKNTVHCEITDPGPGRHPVFFVTEPSRLAMNQIWPKNYRFDIAK